MFETERLIPEDLRRRFLIPLCHSSCDFFRLRWEELDTITYLMLIMPRLLLFYISYHIIENQLAPPRLQHRYIRVQVQHIC